MSPEERAAVGAIAPCEVCGQDAPKTSITVCDSCLHGPMRSLGDMVVGGGQRSCPWCGSPVVDYWEIARTICVRCDRYTSAPGGQPYTASWLFRIRRWREGGRRK